MLLEGKGLVKAFGGLVAVNDFNISVRSGEIVGLIGPNGSGKTTVVNLLCGALPLTSGKVLLDGKDITRCPPHQRALMHILRTFQLNSLVWDFTAMENLKVALYAQHQGHMLRQTILGVGQDSDWGNRALDMLEKLGIADLKDRLVTELSYGQQRMLSLVIALVASPRVLLLDEPVAGLRWDAAENLLTVVQEAAANEGIGVLLIEHNMQAIMKCTSRVVAMSFGLRIAEGTAEEVLGNQEVIDAYLGKEE